MTNISLLSETDSQALVVEKQEGRCLNRRLNTFNCTVCIDHCKTSALTIDNNDVHIAKEHCTGCGSCTAVCPSETFVFADCDLSQIVEECKTFEDVIFNCHHQEKTFPNELQVPCVGAFSIEVLLYIGLKGTGAVYFNLSGCVTCQNYHVLETFRLSLDRVKKTLANDSRCDFIVMKELSDVASMTPKDRRSFLVNIGSNVVSFVKNQYAPSLLRKEASPVTSRRIPKKTVLLAKAITSTGETTSVQLLAQCTPTISINDSCTLCPRCTGMCPTGALKLERHDSRKKLLFIAAQCTGCGLCVAFCKMNALALSVPLHD